MQTRAVHVTFTDQRSTAKYQKQLLCEAWIQRIGPMVKIKRKRKNSRTMPIQGT